MLGRKFSLPFIEPEKLNCIPAEVIAQIPAELAARHSVVPIALDGTTLTVAMENPSDLEIISEITFRTGFMISPVVTPELSLTHALKKYYGVKRELRPVPEEWEVGKSGIQHVGTTRENHSIPNSSSHPAVRKTTKKGGNHLKLVDKNSQTSLQSDGDGILTLERASIWLANVESRDDVATILTHFASQMFKRTALFMIKGERALGWVAKAQGTTVKNFDEFQIPLEAPSILKTIVETKKKFFGPVPFSSENSRIISSFDGSFQGSAALMPLIILGQVVAVLYVEGEGTHPIEYLLFKLQKIVPKAVMALEILILKKKIVML